MSNDHLERIRQIAADLLGVPLDAVTVDSSPDTIEGWDSLQHLNLMLAVEETFGIYLSPEDGERMKSIGAAAELVDERLD
jgi:acyl carrier protein